MSYTDTLASVGFRARRIEAADCGEPTKADKRQAERQCQGFLELCAAEAFANRWFPRTPIQSRRRSVIVEKVVAALGQGPLSSRQIAECIGHEKSTTDRALRELRETGVVRIVGQANVNNGPRPNIYVLTEGV